MATATLSLFPSASLKGDRPDQKGALRCVGRSTKEPDFEMVKMSGNARGIIIAVEEAPAPSFSKSMPVSNEALQPTNEQAAVPSITLSSPEAPLVNGSMSPRNRAETPSPVLTQVCAPVEQRSKSVSPTAVRLPDSPSRSRAPSPLQHEGSPKSHASSPTLVRKGSNASTRTATHSPVMRSMFPRYELSTSLAQQRYYPHAQERRVSPNPRAASIRSICSQQGRQGGRLALPVLEIPSQPSGSAPILQQNVYVPSSSALSTPEELLQLWSIANGQAASEAKDTYSIELSCDSLMPNEEIITLSSASQALYTLAASRGGVAVSRTHPSNPQPTIQICETVLSVPTTTAPLVATLFPKLAELMALDQSSSVAVSHRLNRQASADLQVEALARAQQNEASSLLWDSDSGKYFLVHPTLLDNTSTSFPIEITPSPLAPEKIVISAPETDASTPLLTLALPSRTLTIYTTAITAMPSLYTLDTLLSALLALLLHLHRSSSIPTLPSAQKADVIAPSFPPPPTLLSSTARPAPTTGRTLSTWCRSTFSSPTARLPKHLQDEETGDTMIVTAARTASKNTGSGWIYKPMIDAEDKSLPAATRGVLRTLYWSFEVWVWVLGLFVNLLAVGVVGAGKVIKKL